MLVAKYSVVKLLNEFYDSNVAFRKDNAAFNISKSTVDRFETNKYSALDRLAKSSV